MKENRRQAVKLSLGSGFTLKYWTTPTLLSIALPTHAVLSLGDPFLQFSSLHCCPVN